MDTQSFTVLDAASLVSATPPSRKGSFYILQKYADSDGKSGISASEAAEFIRAAQNCIAEAWCRDPQLASRFYARSFDLSDNQLSLAEALAFTHLKAAELTRSAERLNEKIRRSERQSRSAAPCNALRDLSALMADAGEFKLLHDELETFYLFQKNVQEA